MSLAKTIHLFTRSYEPLVAATCVLSYLLFPSVYVRIGEVLEGINKPVVLGPLSALLTSTLYSGHKILFPKAGQQELIEYPDYPRLRQIVYIGVIFNVTGSVAVATGTFGVKALPSGMGALLVVAGYAIAGFSTFTMLVAASTCKSICAGGR